jgi:hypothetical protein
MPIVPKGLLDENERCMMQHAAKMGCYLGSKGGCASPAPAVSCIPLCGVWEECVHRTDGPQCGLGPLPGSPLM